MNAGHTTYSTLHARNVKEAINRLTHNPINVPVDQYMMLMILLTVLSALLMMMIGVLLYVFDISLDLIPFLPQWLTMLLAVLLIPAGVFVCLYSYPQWRCRAGKPRSTWTCRMLSSTCRHFPLRFRSMISSATSTTWLLSTVRSQRSAVSSIVLDVELFGEDLLTAMENTISVTLIGRATTSTNFFNAKSESYRELARQKLDALLEFLEMIAEIYVTAFVAGPIAIIMLVAQNLSGQSQMEGIMPLMCIGLPLGAIVFIFILYILFPPDNLDIAR